MDALGVGRCASEHDEQTALLRWVDLMAPRQPCLALLYHIPNAGQRHVRYARDQKAQGLRAGVPDLHLPVARHGQHGLWIEMKRRVGGRVSRAQQAWHDRLRAEGHRVVVCEGWHAAREAITEYLGVTA